MNVESAVDKFLVDNAALFDPQVQTSASFRLGWIRAELVKLLKTTQRDEEPIGSGSRRVPVPVDALLEAIDRLEDSEALIAEREDAAARLKAWLPTID